MVVRRKVCLVSCAHVLNFTNNQICQALAVSLQKHLAEHWTLFQKTPLDRKRLSMELVPTAVVLQLGRAVSASDTDAEHMNLGRWQPDFIVISYSNKKIPLGPEVCRPSDTCTSKLAEAYDRNIVRKLQCTALSESKITNIFPLGGQSESSRGSLGLVV